MTTDNDVLTAMITTCFSLSMNDAFSTDEQTEFLVLGKRLRGTLVNLLSATFDDGTPAVVAANSEIQTVNGQLNQATQNLANVANTIQNLGNLVSTLDGLLKVASGFK